MKDLTQKFTLYRECARNLWNRYFLNQMPLEDPWDFRDHFEDICVLLFTSFVLHPIGRCKEKKTPSYMAHLEPLAFLQVIPSLDSGVPVQINREKEGSHAYWDYPLKTIRPPDATLLFIDYFDFDVLGSREFEYCLVRIVESKAFPEIIGRDALINSKDVKIVLQDD